MHLDVIVKQVEYDYITQNIEKIAALTNEAFIGNHKITREAYNRTEEKYRKQFQDLLWSYTIDSIEQIHKHQGMFFVAEDNQKIIGISIGCPYGKSALSEQFIQNVFKSECCFKEVMAGWWNLMAKYEGTPPGEIYHQATMAIDPTYAGKGIGAKICALTAKTIIERGYDGYAVETSSESADQLAEKMKKAFQVFDLDSNGKGLTFRLHLQPNENSEKIHQWFLNKKQIAFQSVAKEIDVQEISLCGVHYHVGDIAIWDSNRESQLPVLIMLHPNSASRLFFKMQMEDKILTENFRLIAMDLPGHGDSKPAENPKETYTLSGYASIVAQTIREMGISKCALFGWSLGGHVAIEALDKIDGLCGVALTGTPPVELSTQGFMEACKDFPIEMSKLMGKLHFTHEEAETFAHVIGKEDWMIEYVFKTDGYARQRLLEWFDEGVGRDQRKLVAETKLPIAIIAGDQDPASPKDYLQTVKFGNLWGLHFIENGSHGVVYERPDIYNPILLSFLKDIFG